MTRVSLHSSQSIVTSMGERKTTALHALMTRVSLYSSQSIVYFVQEMCGEPLIQQMGRRRNDGLVHVENPRITSVHRKVERRSNAS